MPLNCPLILLPYNACRVCRQRHDKECWANPLVPMKLSDLLTVDERIAIIEDKMESFNKQPDTEWSIKQWDYVTQLKGQVVFLTNKVDELLARKPKKKSRFLYT